MNTFQAIGEFFSRTFQNIRARFFNSYGLTHEYTDVNGEQVNNIFDSDEHDMFNDLFDEIDIENTTRHRIVFEEE